MFKNVLQIYSLLSCFVSGIAFLIWSGIVANTVTDYYFADIKLGVVIQNLSSKEDYLSSGTFNERMVKRLEKASKEEVAEILKSERDRLIVQKERESLTALFNEISWGILFALYYAIHWRLYRRASTINEGRAV